MGRCITRVLGLAALGWGWARGAAPKGQSVREGGTSVTCDMCVWAHTCVPEWWPGHSVLTRACLSLGRSRRKMATENSNPNAMGEAAVEWEPNEEGEVVPNFAT